MSNLENVKNIFPDYVHCSNIKSINMNYFPIYICFITYSSDGIENVFNAGNFIDVMVTNYKH